MEKEAKKARKAEKEHKKMVKAMALLEASSSHNKKSSKPKKDNNDDDDDKEDNNNNEDEIMYGAPDDVAWTDKSAAMIEAEKLGLNDKDGPDLSLIYDKDGKKLSNKERKKLLKERAALQRQAEYEQTATKLSAQGAQFACSQTTIDPNDPQWQNSLDIQIPSFTISAAGKVLFQDATFNIGHGKRYGLVGPNGRGKSTLLKMIASQDLILPPRVDYLYVE
jgi:ATP-binding cassette subfamily F protein 1